MEKLFKKIFKTKKKTGDVQVIGTLRIPSRYKNYLESLGDDLNIFIGIECGGILGVNGDPRGNYDRYSVRCEEDKRKLFGASFQETDNKFSSIREIIIPGKFIDGAVFSAYRVGENCVPYPGIVIIEII